MKDLRVLFNISIYKCPHKHTCSQIHKSLYVKIEGRIIQLNSIKLHNKHLVVACTYSKASQERLSCQQIMKAFTSQSGHKQESFLM
jgi:hypothetical protein